MKKPHVVIIGAGFTGLATAHDLALRGVGVTVVEQGSVANGCSGRTHGVLHSGGRYAVKIIIEMVKENKARLFPKRLSLMKGSLSRSMRKIWTSATLFWRTAPSVIYLS